MQRSVDILSWIVQQVELEERLQLAGHANAGAGIGLLQIFVKAPTVPGDAEQQEHQGAARQDQIGHQEVLGIHDAHAPDQGHTAPDVVAQDTGDASDQQEQAVQQGGLFAAPAEVVAAGGQQVLKDRRDGGEAGEGHEQEEQGAPDPAAGHVGEDVGQRLKNQGWAGIGLHAEAEAGGEDNQAAHEGHEGIQGADAHRLAGEGVLASHVAAEDLHGGDAQAEGKEGLVHGGGDDGAQACFLGTAEVGQQVELHALAGTG